MPLSSSQMGVPPCVIDEKASDGLVAELETPRGSVAKVPGSPSTFGLSRPVIIDEKALWRKVDTRVLPILAFMYLFSFMDRANIGKIGNARLQGLEKELKMTGDQYNLVLVSTRNHLIFAVIELMLYHRRPSSSFPIAFASSPRNQAISMASPHHCAFSFLGPPSFHPATSSVNGGGEDVTDSFKDWKLPLTMLSPYLVLWGSIV
ncbi:hypothetical protein NMY22_g12079 [Coprinellus aureogranulatus]|nr:hypothetical protein NMY22_g12079 [Coprinellus aureogranulatus]